MGHGLLVRDLWLKDRPEDLEGLGDVVERGTPRAQRFRGVLVFKAHKMPYQSTVGLRVIKNKKKDFTLFEIQSKEKFKRK